MALIVVKATWDPEADVWVAESEDVPGLVTEAESIEALQRKLPGIIQDLLEDDGSDAGQEIEIPVELVANVSSRVTIRRVA
jgi:predicted RNase H-like HicB family nuclease